jgi:hypothetical protein
MFIQHLKMSIKIKNVENFSQQTKMLDQQSKILIEKIKNIHIK